jgi:hypothetical protein
MDTDATGTESTPAEEATSGKSGRTPTVVLTSPINLKKQLNGIAKQIFRIRSIDFTDKKIRQQPIFINGTKVPYIPTQLNILV